ncbi:extensin isoform X2 [Bombyx mandarina]|uniref:Zasp-like motif domain-containing protein n=2 Tax=Bombyx TaxID=7090 RepID=A0A8R1WGE7_BOMMO|nr:extensin isoform X6 [Bombyx mori]XP_028027217.1 extensin isoform X2 [Bombyx mandarina]
MATGPKIVHKQFNSPIGLYSQQNIKETLNKHLKNLDNGSVGIDFNNPTTDKPANLANSAVLRMLEEEERNRKGYSQKKVVWPPVPETNGYHNPQQSPVYDNNAQHSPSAQPPYQKQPQYQPEPQYQAQPPHFQPQYQQPQSQQPQYPQSQPGFCEGRRQEQTGLSKLIPVGPGVTASPLSPSQYRVGPASPGIAPQPFRPQPNRWAPVPAPLSPQTPGSQPSYTQQISPQSQYSSQSPYSEPAYQTTQRHFEPPPSTITLRPQPPVHQKPSPVFASQPAAASFKGGVNMRGDQKWPPQSVKEAVAAENEARLKLAKGPACRPRKVKKDYSSFFAKHALSHNYPGYRAPPGTQHFEDFSGRSSY